MSAEERRDAAIAAAEGVGARVRSAQPLALPSDPHTVVAYALSFETDDYASWAALERLRAETEQDDTRAMVRWVDPTSPEIDEPEGV